MAESTFEVLRAFLGLVAANRGTKKRRLRDELIKRGVSPYGVVAAMEEILFQIGNAADNRIEEIDAQMDEKGSLEDMRREYTFRLTESEVERCYDCKHTDIGFGASGSCSLLNIRMANVRKSKCGRWER